MRGAVSLLALALCAGCAGAAAAADVRDELADLDFDAFLERSFRKLVERSPEAVVEIGLEEELGTPEQLDDISEAYLQGTQALEAELLELLRARPRAALTSSQQVAYDAYEWYLDDRVRDQPFADLVYRVTPSLNSVVVSTELFFTDVHPLSDAKEGAAYVVRLRDVGRKLGQLEDELSRLEERRVLAPRRLIGQARIGVEAIVASDPRRTPYYLRLAERLPSEAALLDEAAQVIARSVQPAYASLDRVLDRLERAGPEGIGVSVLPNAAAYYAQALRHHTTADVTAAELHQLGMAELARIHTELDQRFAARGYPAGAPLRDQLRRAAEEGGVVPADQVLAEYTRIIERTEARLPAAFDLLPRAKVVVKGGPRGGFYIAPSLDGSRPGAFFAGSGSAARFEMPTLAYHEAVPGHHLQIGVAQDLGLPLFQRVATFTGYVEGWALYAERLAFDLGWYADDPFGDIGRLQAEALRAARLVVDTGIHAEGWSIERAVTFLAESTGMSTASATAQVFRYASWPGQATAYWTGAARILALREAARSGPDFDLRRFHRTILAHGALPLSVLDGVARGR